jgi:hypothetical protein
VDAAWGRGIHEVEQRAEAMTISWQEYSRDAGAAATEKELQKQKELKRITGRAKSS